MAAQNDFLSFGFIFWYGLVILNLGIYAIVWQQIIKHLPLTTAYANKAVTIVWGILWGLLFFQEQIKWNMVVGAVIVTNRPISVSVRLDMEAAVTTLLGIDLEHLEIIGGRETPD